MKFGALPRDDRPAPQLADYILSASALPVAPLIVDRELDVPSWPMYLNDQIGDCTVAGMFHAVSSMTAYSRQTSGGVTFTDDEATRVYSAVSGYDPATGANDNGAQLQDVCRFMVKTGATDTSGKVHKLAAWAEVENFTNLRLLKRVLYAFGTVYLAIDCPDSALQQFQDGQAWSVVPGAQFAGGHCIVMQYSAAYAPNIGADETVITWGAKQKMTMAFAKQYIVEAVAVVSEDDVNVQSGRNPAGLALQQMIADCQTRYLV